MIRALPRRVAQYLLVASVVGAPFGVAGALGGVAYAALPGADAQLTRAPYLSDLTTTSVQVSWATSTQSRGVIRYGPAGDCTANSVTSATLGSPITVNGVREYANRAAVTGLSAGTSYCYRVYTGGGTPVDLLGTGQSPRFTTLDPADSTAPFTFAVLGDWGDTTNSGVNDGSPNVNQANLDAQLAGSGARFVLSTGDVGNPGGSQTNYGDLNQTGVNISSVFAPAYWAVPGQSLPVHGTTGNHGQNATFLSTWPQDASVAASQGVYGMIGYPSIDGTTPGRYPTSYYAFSTGGVRFYVLDASWGNSNTGTADGGDCGVHCAIYQVDHDAHWRPDADEPNQYRWLARDLSAHPGGLKVAVFHFPLHSDDATEPSDEYLQNTPGSSGTLEQLLHDNGVQLVFNGHAHDYQRNVAQPGGVTSYVTGGGGSRLSAVGGRGCASTDAYAVGWSYSKARGNACGAAQRPASDAQVFHFLKVTVSGSTVTVTPTDSTGRVFDEQRHDFRADPVAPSAPSGLAATLPSPTRVALDWSAATDNVGVSAYDVYRDGSYLATTVPAVTSYTDPAIVAGSGHRYQVQARDLAGNTQAATVDVNGGPADSAPPSAPSGLAAIATGGTSVSLSWTAATDDAGIAGYTVFRDGVAVASVPGGFTSYRDFGLTPGASYTYRVTASDVVGNGSSACAPASVTTPADTTPPTAPGTPTVTSLASHQVGLSWTGSSDNVGVARYEVLRDSAVVGSVTGTLFSDPTVASGTVYTYRVRAYDAAGNAATSDPTTVTTPVDGAIFYDGFESNDLSQWSTVTGLGPQAALVHAGGYATRETSTGTATYAYKSLPSSYSELWAQAWVSVVSRTTSVNLFGFRTSGGGSIVNVYLDANGRVSLRNNAGGVTTYGTATVAAGGWHRVTLHALVAGDASSLDVALDGVPVPGLTLTGQNMGINPIATLQLGETATGRTYDVALDDVTVSPSPL